MMAGHNEITTDCWLQYTWDKYDGPDPVTWRNAAEWVAAKQAENRNREALMVTVHRATRISDSSQRRMARKNCPPSQAICKPVSRRCMKSTESLADDRIGFEESGRQAVHGASIELVVWQQTEPEGMATLIGERLRVIRA